MEDSVFFDANKEKLIITESENRELVPTSNADTGQVESIESTPSLKRPRESDDELKEDITTDEPESKRIKNEEPVVDKQIELSIDTTSEIQLPQSEAVPIRKHTRWNSEDFDVDKSEEGKDSGQVSRLDSTWSEVSLNTSYFSICTYFSSSLLLKMKKVMRKTLRVKRKGKGFANIAEEEKVLHNILKTLIYVSYQSEYNKMCCTST